MKKYIIFVAFCYLLAGVVVLGCLLYQTNREKQALQAELDELQATEPFSENWGESYIKWSYNSGLDSRKDDVNLTSTSAIDGDYAGSEFLVSSWEEYQGYLGVIAEKEAAFREAVPANRGQDTLFTLRLDTYCREIDEAFFRENKLAVVDFCFEGYPYLVSALDDIQIEDGVVKISIRRDYTPAYTADRPGDIYWIPVPTSCSDVEVTYKPGNWSFRRK